MKKRMIICCGLAFLGLSAAAQSVGIGTASPNISAQLDITSSSKGLLIPRMTDAEKTAIASPAQGLMIFNTTTNSFQYYNGVSWINFTHSGILSGTNNRIAKFSGAWGLQNSLLTDNASGVSLNTSGSNADGSALLDISSTTKGVLFPRMNTTQRNAITTPAAGLMILNTDTYRTNIFNGSSWTETTGPGISLPYIDSSNTAFPDKLFSVTNLGSGNAISGETRSAVGLAGNGVYGLASNTNPSVMNTGVTGYNASTNLFGTGVYGYHDGKGVGVYGVVKGNGTAVRGYASSQFGGTGSGIGVEGISTNNYGVKGSSSWYPGVRGESTNSSGLMGVSENSYGIYGESVNGNGIYAYSANSTGIYAQSAGNKAGNFENNSITYPTLSCSNFAGGKSAVFFGDVSISGDQDNTGVITVENGKGIVRSNSATQQKVVRMNGNFALSNIGVGASLDAVLNFENFSAPPTVVVGQVSNGTGEWNKIMLTPFNVTATECSIRLTNLSSNTVTMTGTWSFLIVGPK
ncbi:MAG: hypothetical protein U0V75_01720 [Ferruginibacter sp.]